MLARRAGQRQQVDDEVTDAARIGGRFLRQSLVQVRRHSHGHNHGGRFVLLSHRLSITEIASHS